MIEALSDIIDNVILALAPLIDAAGDPEQFGALLAELGWTVNSVPQPLLDLATAGSALIDTIGSDDVSLEQALGSVKQLIDAILAIETNADSAFPSEVDIAVFKATIGRDLLDYLVVEYLLHNVSRLGILLKLAGIIRIVQTPAAGLRGPYRKRVVLWDRVGELLTDPITGFKETANWDSVAPQLAQIVADLANLLEFYDLQLIYFVPQGDQLAFVNAGATVPLADPLGVDMGFNFDLGTSAGASAGVQFLLRPPTAERGYGFSILPYALLNGAQSIPLSDTLTLTIEGDADFTKGVSVTFAPSHSVETQSGFLGGAPVNPAKVEVGLKFTPAAGDSERVLLGTADASRLAVNSIGLSLGADLISSSQLDAFVEIAFDDAHIVVRPAQGDMDSFLASLIGPNGVSATLSCGVRLSSLTGFHFTGSGGLEANFPVNAQIGPLGFQALSVGFKPVAGAGFDFNIGATVTGTVGPLSIIANGIGFTFSARFPDPPKGNLGPLDADFKFLPPSGAGISIDSAGVSGGGFLALANGEYSGALQLKFNDLALQAFGLITTQVAGSDGYSLIALIDADFPPVQLGWGFTLDGVGGLLAVHRTASVDNLRAAVKSGKVASILFPTKPISNAPDVLSALDSFFPTAPGRFLFGPMALIGWGTPTVLTASVAVILELPEPIEIILLAKLTATLPTPSSALVKLNMDALGVLDLTQDELSLDASLFDSKLISFPISGDMALRANWSSAQREFLLAIGGFHPQFNPPVGFPSLNRVTINMPSGIVSKLRLAAYLAITSNSVQFGAALDVYIGVSGCGISGHLGFDALLQLNPFHFAADISGSVAVTVGGDDLASVSLDATLSGPAPWHIAGKFKIHIIFFDVSISFSESWGLSAPSQQTSAIDVGALLNTALADPRNWSSQLPAGLSALVATRQVNDASSLFAHPLAFLEVHEQIVPLDLTITHFGEAIPSRATEFSITDFRVGNQSTPYTAVKDDFAPAQFFDLSDSDKLSRPSFERYGAGAIMAGNLVTNGTSFAKTIDYESFFINTPGVVTVDEGVPQPFPWTALPIVMRTGSAALKAISQASKLRYAAPGNPIAVAEPSFTLASTSTLAAVTTPAAVGTTYSNAAAALKSALVASPPLRDALQIVASHELIKVAA